MELTPPSTTTDRVCALGGCIDPAASNYNPDAVVDDGTCLPSTCATMSAVLCTGAGPWANTSILEYESNRFENAPGEYVGLRSNPSSFYCAAPTCTTIDQPVCCKLNDAPGGMGNGHKYLKLVVDTSYTQTNTYTDRGGWCGDQQDGFSFFGEMDPPTISGDVNLRLPGKYLVHLECTDSGGLTSGWTRFVTVVLPTRAGERSILNNMLLGNGFERDGKVSWLGLGKPGVHRLYEDTLTELERNSIIDTLVHGRDVLDEYIHKQRDSDGTRLYLDQRDPGTVRCMDLRLDSYLEAERVSWDCGCAVHQIVQIGDQYMTGENCTALVHPGQEAINMSDLRQVLASVPHGVQLKYTAGGKNRTVYGRPMIRTDNRETSRLYSKIVRTDTTEVMQVPIALDMRLGYTEAYDFVCFAFGTMDICCTMTHTHVSNGENVPCQFVATTSNRIDQDLYCDTNSNKHPNTNEPQRTFQTKTTGLCEDDGWHTITSLYTCSDAAVALSDGRTINSDFSYNYKTFEHDGWSIISNPNTVVGCYLRDNIEDFWSLYYNSLLTTETSDSVCTPTRACLCTRQWSVPACCFGDAFLEYDADTESYLFDASFSTSKYCAVSQVGLDTYNADICPEGKQTGSGTDMVPWGTDTECTYCTAAVDGCTHCGKGLGKYGENCETCGNGSYTDSYNNNFDTTACVGSIVSCPVGTGVSTVATASANTVCDTLPCPSGQYSDTDSTVQMCQPCTQCQWYEYQDVSCSSTQDTQCGACYNVNGNATCNTGGPAGILTIDCHDGYVAVGTPGLDLRCEDIDECLVGNGGCDLLTTCTNTLGSRNCSDCPDGYIDIGTGETSCLLDACEFVTCGHSGVCTNDGGGYVCGECSAGYEGGSDKGCTDVNECLTGNGGCDVNALCTNTEGSSTCGACAPGYTGTGDTVCIDINECLVQNGGCPALIVCNNTLGSSNCGACIPGYTGDSTTGCSDVNECLVGNGGCDVLTECTNTIGSRACSACPNGYVGTGETSCMLDICLNIDCGHSGTCTNGDGMYVCAGCGTGYTGGDDKGCTDTNECLVNNGGCDANSLCTNNEGSWTCGACLPGFIGSGDTLCTDIDECLVNNGGCDVNAHCVNTVGSSTCGPCGPGYTGTGDTSCTDIDECLVNNGGCDALTTCGNTMGNYTCTQCPLGYVGNGKTGCADVNECHVFNGGCDTLVTCNNTIGSRICGECPDGYSGDGIDGCLDIDECLTNNGGCNAYTQCTNTIGNYTCGVCPGGFTGTGYTVCNDIDECLTNNGGCDALVSCTNSLGSRICGACPFGYSGNGIDGCSTEFEFDGNNAQTNSITTIMVIILMFTLVLNTC